ncbi:carbohydrate sulfotransferase 9-like [Sceloporus undulatus]|uniref:carbohydrate sulfotransferase 9-like n=1 Tax=Sceloporus undulatus TaxID=8520 RepID=UPI001C4C0416|nr:carbohydrate sulfotransferase 9-like [Sceloporus undulatus]
MNNPLQKLFFILLFSPLLGMFLLQLFRILNTEMTDSEELWLQMQHNRRDTLNATCLNKTLSRSEWQLEHRVAQQLFVDDYHKFIYCSVPKAGCSNWKKILILLKLNLSRDVADVIRGMVHKTNLLKTLSSYSPKKQVELLSTYTKVMVTRHPLERLVSAYRDKFLHPSGYYSTVVANEIKVFSKRKQNFTENVTFQEFINYVVTRNLKNMDVHWKPMFLLCDPCNIHYDILGKFETLSEDADRVLRRISAPESLYYPDSKSHASEKRTNNDITLDYLRKLTFDQVRMVMEAYQIDFSMFGYSFPLKTGFFL